MTSRPQQMPLALRSRWIPLPWIVQYRLYEMLYWCARTGRFLG